MDTNLTKLIVNAVFDWLEASQAGHPVMLLVVKQLRKIVLANVGDVAAKMPPRVVAAMKR